MILSRKYIITLALFLIGCAGNSDKGGNNFGNKRARLITQDSPLNRISIQKEIVSEDKDKITKIYNDFRAAFVSNNSDKINEQLQILSKYKIDDPVIKEYKQYSNNIKRSDDAIKNYLKKEASQNAAKATEEQNRNKAQQQLDNEKVKFDQTKPALKNLAMLKNTEPNGKTKQLNKAIESNNYTSMIHWLKTLKLITKEEEATINKYEAVKKNVGLAQKSVDDCKSKVDKIEAEIKKIQKEKNKVEEHKKESTKKLAEAKQKLDILIQNGELKKQIEKALDSDPKFKKASSLSDLKLVDSSDNTILIYEYVKGKSEKTGKVSGIKVKKLIYNKSANPKDKNYFFKFSSGNFKKEIDGSISAQKKAKPIEIKYKKDQHNNYIFEFENNYSSVPGEENIAKFESEYSLLLSGSAVGLSYSDFGYLDEIANATNNSGEKIKKFHQFKTIVGGYDEKKIDMSKVNIDKDIKYSGKIVGFVLNTSGSADPNNWKSEKISGNVNLTLKKDKTEDVDINFKDYYNMKFKSKATDESVRGLVLEDKRKTNGIYKDYSINNSGTGKFKKTYYGDDKGKAGSEASGRFNYNQGNINIDSTFGVKR